MSADRLAEAQRDFRCRVSALERDESLRLQRGEGDYDPRPLVKRSKRDDETRLEQEEKPVSKVVGFRDARVFDVPQTEGEELPQMSVISGDQRDLPGTLRRLIARCGIELRYEEEVGGALGVSEGGRIAILKELPAAEEFAVLAHELAHELSPRTERRKETIRIIRERKPKRWR